MKELVYVTGNEYKAAYFQKMIGLKIEHAKADIEELQDLDITKVVEHKAREAYTKLNRPVLVEDTWLSFHALGELPGTFIKWFQQEIGEEKLCELLNNYDDRGASAGASFAYFDGQTMQVFHGMCDGSIADKPRGVSGFGWNVIFIPKGSKLTFGEMEEEEFSKWYRRVKPFDELKAFLEQQECVR